MRLRPRAREVVAHVKRHHPERPRAGARLRLHGAGRVPHLPGARLPRPHRRRQPAAGRGRHRRRSSSAGTRRWLATAAGVGAGLCAGLVTGFLHLLLKSGDSDSTNYGPKLLAGILTMTALYTVNLRIMGRSNTPLLGVEAIFDKIGALLSVPMIGWNLILALAVLAVVVKYVLDWFLHTEFGLACRPPATTSR